MLDGHHYRFANANAVHSLKLCESSSKYGAPVDSDRLHLTNHAEIDATLDAVTGMGLSVIRSFSSFMSVGKVSAVQPKLGVFNPDNLEPTDYLLKRCNELGLKVIAPLTDNYPETATGYKLGGKFWYCTANGVSTVGDAAEFFANAAVIKSFLAHTSFVVNHINRYTGVAYRDDPAILAWETGNEMSLYPASSAPILPWTKTVADHLKLTEGVRQLVLDGCYGLIANNEAAQLDLANVDIYSTHAYDQWRNPAAVTAVAAQCHAHRKAFVVGEYNWHGVSLSWWQRLFSRGGSGWTLDQMLTALQGSPYVDGDCFWELMAKKTTWGDGYMLHWPPDDAGKAALQVKIVNHAVMMRSTA